MVMLRQLFGKYFGAGTPIVTIPGRTHPVTELFLEDAIEVTRHGVNKSAEWARKGSKGRGGGGGAGGRNSMGAQQAGHAHEVTPFEQKLDMELSESELGRRYGSYAAQTVTALNDLDHDAIDYELIRDVVLWVMETTADVSSLPKNRQGVWGQQVRIQIIRHARTHSVGKYQSCMF